MLDMAPFLQENSRLGEKYLLEPETIHLLIQNLLYSLPDVNVGDDCYFNNFPFTDRLSDNPDQGYGRA